MENTVVKQIDMDNRHTLLIHDHSRRIGADAFLVVMTAQVNVEISPELFKETDPGDAAIDDIIAVLGNQVCYEYRVERNFIMEKDREEVFQALMRGFLDTLGPYVAKPQFPAKFVLKEYRDKID